MARFIMSSKDREGRSVQVECGFRGSNGNDYLLLKRLPPHYAKPPMWLVRLSPDTLVQRVDDGSSMTFFKAYSIQDLTESEKSYLLACKPGAAVVPFFNFSYPNLIRILGKKFYRLAETELTPILNKQWVFIP